MGTMFGPFTPPEQPVLAFCEVLAVMTIYMSRDTRKSASSGFLTMSNTNGPVQLQKIDRSLKFWILEEEDFF